ncbi:MAG: HD-GYP domain-containing protein [Cellvibrionaceae bacterium]|nr:HD-GYP domain-containing protein [Cellvibrionaceae bacterium]
MSSNTKKVHVSELRVGMFVSQLDRNWLETPFLLQGFHIEEEGDIDVIAEYCEYVYIDDEKSVKSKASEHSSNVGTARHIRVNPDIFEPEVPLEDEHRRVMGTFRQARSLTKTLLDDIRLGGAINTEQARHTVNECVHSVIRHPDALLWMSKMRDENEYTAEHCLNVCILAIAFGRQLGMSEQELQNLGMCGLLHDVGKMKIPAEILDKPDTLTPKEMRIMMAHTVHGRNLLLSSSGIYTGAIDVALSHHERVDGTGYPRQLAGNSISRYSKIIAIVDAYDAMTADRCYQSARTSTEAIKIIYKERGQHFDEQLALKFLQTVGLYPAGSIVELYSGEVGMVIEAHPRFRHLPRIVMLRDRDKQPVAKETMVDLSLIEKGELSKDYLIKQVWKDKTFGITLKNYLERGLFMA